MADKLIQEGLTPAHIFNTVNALVDEQVVQDTAVADIVSEKSTQDTSIAALINEQTSQDVSIAALAAEQAVQDAAISALVPMEIVTEYPVTPLDGVMYVKVMEAVLAWLSGTHLFLMDSLTAGTGNTKSIPYWVADAAEKAGRLRDIWVRPLLAVIPDTNYATGSNLGTATTVDNIYAPNKMSILINGTQSAEVFTIASNRFNWVTTKIYFIKTPSGGSFDVTIPESILAVDTSGIEGEIGFVEVTNNAADTAPTIQLSNFTGAVSIAGCRVRVAEIVSDYLDVINFSRSGVTTAQFNECVNIEAWYTEMAITNARINNGTNDGVAGEVSATNSLRTVMNSLANVGVTGQDVLIVRPNDNGRRIGDMWETIRDEYLTRFTSIVRVYGNLATFDTNSWMLPTDNTHPNETFNEIQGLAEYNMELEGLHDAIDLGVDGGWLTKFSWSSYLTLDSTAIIVGDFSGETRVIKTDKDLCIWELDDTTFDNVFQVRADGALRFKLDGVELLSSVGLIANNTAHTIKFARVGSVLTLRDTDDTVLVTGEIGTGNVTFNRFGKTIFGTNKDSIIGWISIDNQHKWLFNQHYAPDVVNDDISGNNATWVSFQDLDTNPMHYSVLSDGTLLDYHYNERTELDWGVGNVWLT